MDQPFFNRESSLCLPRGNHLLKARVFEYYRYLTVKWRKYLPLADFELSQLGLRTTSFEDKMDYFSSFIARSKWDPKGMTKCDPCAQECMTTSLRNTDYFYACFYNYTVLRHMTSYGAESCNNWGIARRLSTLCFCLCSNLKTLHQ